MSAQTKFLLTVFYLACFLALFAPVALATNTTHNNHTNTSTTQTHKPTGTDEPSVGATHLTSTVALFGALVAAAVFTI